jgi:MFS family permease
MLQNDLARRADAVLGLKALARLGVPGNVWFLGLTSLLTDISSEMVVSILPAYLVLQLGLTPLVFGAVDGIYQGVSGITRIAGGFIGDRAGRYKGVALFGYAASAACKGLMLFVSSGSAIAGVIVADRIGKGIRTAPRDALIALSVKRSDLGAAFGVHRALDSIGATLGPFVGFAVLALAPKAFDAVFVVSLAFALMGTLALLLFVHDPGRPDRVDRQRRVSMATAFHLVRSPPLTKLVVASAALSMGTVSDGFLYLILQRSLQFSAAAIPLLFAGTAACYFLTSVPFGLAADRFGRRSVFLAGYGLLLLSYGLVLAPLNAAVQVCGVVALLGAYYGATDGVVAALASSVLPVPLRGTGLSTVTTMTGAARAISSVMFGYLWTVWSTQSVVLLFAVVLMAAMVVAAGVLARSTEGGES